MENRSPVFLRAFSIQIFHDSKIAEKEIGAAARIIAAFHPEEKYRELESDEVLEEFEIYRNPVWIMMKGKGRFRMIRDMKDEAGLETAMGRVSERMLEETSKESSGAIDVSSFPGGIGISQEDIPKVCWDQTLLPDRVITIENLTSFHQWKSGEDLIIYLGGYANQAKRSFVTGLKAAYPDAEFCHFGDIDCGGFRIWKNLSLETGIDFRPLYMDEETYTRYCDGGRPLTERDLLELKRMKEEPFYCKQKGLFEMMIRKRVKLEQESVSV